MAKRTTTQWARLSRRLASFLFVLAFLGLVSCSDNQHPVELKFVAVWDGSEIGCNTETTSILDLRLYVSDITLISSTGREARMELLPDAIWQQENVAMIDLENGGDTCMNGTADMNARVIGSSAARDIAALRFTVGVPFELNHANPLQADAPLNNAAMHWHWRSGYKFMRAGIANPDDSFWLHLGSTGCEGTVRNISACSAENRVSVLLQDFSPQSDHIAIDLRELFSGVDLHDGVHDDCSASPSEQTCEAPFDALGLSFAGKQAAAKRVFRVLR